MKSVCTVDLAEQTREWSRPADENDGGGPSEFAAVVCSSMLAGC